MEVLSQIYTNNPRWTPAKIHRGHNSITLQTMSIHFIWENEDMVTSLAGGTRQFFTLKAEVWEWTQKSNSKNKLMVTTSVVPGDHVPFGDNPQDINAFILKWMKEVILL